MISKTHKNKYIPFEFKPKNIKTLITDSKKDFSIVYIPKLKIHLLSVPIERICSYEKYYSILEEDLKLYKENTNAFYEKFKTEISGCSTERFVASQVLSDYDGISGFHELKPCAKGKVNPFQHHAYVDGIFCARIQWANEEILVPPLQAIPCEDINKKLLYEFPLRKHCVPYIDSNNNIICYKYEGGYPDVNKA